MRNTITLLAGLLVLVGISGCRSKDDLVLYRPGDMKVWPTVDAAELQQRQQALPKVELVTSMGRIVVELYEDEAPVSVANFLQYVQDGYFAGTIFHRVEPGLVIQGGGFSPDMSPKPTRPAIINEAGNGLRNSRGTLGMARTSDMNSATSQFYINLVDNSYFNGDGVSDGYAVFGRVYEGMDVVDAIARVETGTAGGMANVPLQPVVIESARQLD